MANTGNPGHGPAESSRFGQTGGALETTGEKAQELASSVQEKAQEAWESSRRAATSVTETAGDAWDEAIRFMRRYPVATFCAGAAVGALLTMACRTLPSSSSYMIRGMERSGHDPQHPYGT